MSTGTLTLYWCAVPAASGSSATAHCSASKTSPCAAVLDSLSLVCARVRCLPGGVSKSRSSMGHCNFSLRHGLQCVGGVRDALRCRGSSSPVLGSLGLLCVHLSPYRLLGEPSEGS